MLCVGVGVGVSMCIMLATSGNWPECILCKDSTVNIQMSMPTQ